MWLLVRGRYHPSVCLSVETKHARRIRTQQKQERVFQGLVLFWKLQPEAKNSLHLVWCFHSLFLFLQFYDGVATCLSPRKLLGRGGTLHVALPAGIFKRSASPRRKHSFSFSSHQQPFGVFSQALLCVKSTPFCGECLSRAA